MGTHRSALDRAANAPVQLARILRLVAIVAFTCLGFVFASNTAEAQGAVAPSCPDGYQLSGNACVEAAPTPTCPDGYSFDGATCVEEVAQAEADRSGAAGEHLFSEDVEGVYGNSWRGVAVNDDTVQADVYIHGEGKTASFDGVLALDCETGGHFWKTAAVWDAEPADDDMIADMVPDAVIENAEKTFCGSQ
ncbi:MAG: hypothetical protein AAGD23_09925 [Pseudomonadota bacterium]